MASQLPSKDVDGPAPIAVIGMACRFSGIATNPEALWQMLSKGLTGWSSSAGARFKLDSFWHPKPEMNGSVSPKD
jgi:acyl transferase domain-containing protein